MNRAFLRIREEAKYPIWGHYAAYQRLSKKNRAQEAEAIVMATPWKKDYDQPK